MVYKFFLVVWLVLCIALPITYENVWKERVINRSHEYFCVRKIERGLMSGRKWFFVYGAMLWLLLIADGVNQIFAQGNVDKASTIWGGIFILIIWWLLALVFCRQHKALPLAKYLSVKDMVESIEQEAFVEVGPKLWYSPNWIRVSTAFYPKSAITGIEKSGRGSRAWLCVYTVMGMIFRYYDFSYYDKKLADKVKKMQNSLVVSHMIDLSKWSVCNALGDYDGKKMFHNYMLTHTTKEFIYNPVLLQQVVDEILKRERE